MRARRYYTGQQVWKQWEKAGVVGTKLNFTDDDIITHQALARTADVMKNCRAMDAAVAYELASVGANHEGVAPEKLLSDFTRSAYIIEDTRCIGWGTHADTDVPSCGHDEVTGVEVLKFYPATAIRVFEHENISENENMTIVVDFNTEGDWQDDEIDNLDDVTAYLLKNGMRRDRRHNLYDTVQEISETPYETYLKYLKSVCPRLESYLDKNYELVFRGAPWVVKRKTNGVCKSDADGEDECRHHDGITTTGWAIHLSADGQMEELYTNAPCDSNFMNDMLRQRKERRSGSKSIPATGKPQMSDGWITWDSQRRSMLRKVNDKKVLSLIRKSLGRMSRRNWGVVSKMYLKRCGDCGSTTDHLPSATNCTACDSENLVEKQRGNNAIYKWKDWGWLANVHAYIQTTRSKNRKVGDVENGWEWFPCNTKKSYGMEMSEFAWRPVNEKDLDMHTFSVNTKVKSYYGSQYYTNKSVLSFGDVLLFHTRDGAERAATGIVDNLLKTEGAVVKSRTYTDGEYTPRPDYNVTYSTVSSTFILKGEIDPDDYMSPSEVNKMAVSASPQVIAQHKEKFREFVIPISTKIIEKQEGDEE